MEQLGLGLEPVLIQDISITGGSGSHNSADPCLLFFEAREKTMLACFFYQKIVLWLPSSNRKQGKGVLYFPSWIKLEPKSCLLQV